jgi:hypothetical protein
MEAMVAAMSVLIRLGLDAASSPDALTSNDIELATKFATMMVREVTDILEELYDQIGKCKVLLLVNVYVKAFIPNLAALRSDLNFILMFPSQGLWAVMTVAPQCSK